ncbi:MAG: uroporphyrinogen decarboxylase [Spirochaetaceae bacterium]|jgi:uroporphyrinogen decarboxylase|nr:uroporphyrinogen decarboxylase [Spirochaetaceae bacterium]
MNKRELVLNTFHNEETERVPVGFWFHFAKNELEDVFEKPELLSINLEGHRKFYREFQPDFVKIMTDGFFAYPNEVFRKAASAAELKATKPIGEGHPWIRKQIEFAKTLTGEFGKEVLCFYNIFSPATLFKFLRTNAIADSGQKAGAANPQDRLLAGFIEEGSRDTDRGLAGAFAAVASDLAALAEGVITEGGADGIYYSVQDVADPGIDSAAQQAALAPGDHAVLEAANKAGGLNILHICGYAGHSNKLDHFVDYPAQVINWAACFEGIKLGEGKRLFGGRPVIGGFDNTREGILYSGSRKEIEEETGRLLSESGRVGVALGADCTLPRDIDYRRLEWVRQAARNA